MSFQKYLTPDVDPIRPEIELAVFQSPMDSTQFIPFSQAKRLSDAGYFEIETGLCLKPNGPPAYPF